MKRRNKKPVTQAIAPLILHTSYALPRLGLPAPLSFQRWVQAALISAKYTKQAELSIRLVDAPEGRTLNHQYRGKNYATNVLSFTAEFPPEVVTPLLGDLVICAPVVAREAHEQRKVLAHHYAHLTIHGVLHLIGYDHETKTEAKAMEALEIQTLEQFNITNPYR